MHVTSIARSNFGIRRTALFTCTFICAFLAFPTTSRADIIDTVYFRNGDRLIGEVLGLTKALLKLKTDGAGTLSIEWEDIEAVVTRTRFQIKTTSGRYYYGRLDRGMMSGGLAVVSDSTRKEISPEHIVEVYPIKDDFFERFTGKISAGMSYAKANEIAQLSVAGHATYNRYLDRTSIDVNSDIANSANSDVSERHDASILEIFDFSNAWFGAGNAAYARNTELGLRSRYSVSAGAGRYLMQSQSEHMYVWGGLSANYENSENVEKSFELELPVFAELSLFKYDHPKLDIIVQLDVYQGITVFNRIRLNGDIQLSWELVYDVYWKLTFYDNYDHRPLDGSGPKNDFGTGMGLEWRI